MVPLVLCGTHTQKCSQMTLRSLKLGSLKLCSLGVGDLRASEADSGCKDHHGCKKLFSH